MKKFWGLLVLVMVMLCGTAMAASWESNYPKAPADRLAVTLPQGMKADIDCSQDGYINVIVRTSQMTLEDWKSVMIHGGYPNVSLRTGVLRPTETTEDGTLRFDTCISFNGGIFEVTEDDFFNTFANELNNKGVWYNNHARAENAESVGEIVADQCMLIPEFSSSGGGGYFIAWMDADLYNKLYPDEMYPDGYPFTAEEIKANEQGLFFFEYVELRVVMDTTEPFYVPFRSLSKATMAPTKTTSLMPSSLEVKDILNGDIIYSVGDLTDNVDAPLVLNAPDNAAYLAVFSPMFESLDTAERIPVSEGEATYWHQIHRDTCVLEEQLVAVWLDENSNMLDYGVFWLHAETENYKPTGWYVDSVELNDGQTVTWEAPPSSRIVMENNCADLGVGVSYDPESGVFHVSYDAVKDISGNLGHVKLSIKAPDGMTAARINHGGGNMIMGPDEGIAQGTHHIIVDQSYITTESVDENNMITLLDREPLRHYAAGPVDVYVQMDSVWPYGGGQYVIYWYENEAAANNDPGHPEKIEYIADTTDAICVTTRTEIVDSEEAIQGGPVQNVTCVSPDHHGKDWHLVIRRHPQRGNHACHWELYLENECGDYEPLDGETTFYMPYPNGHSYDHEHDCARDKDGNEASYEIYHYNASYDSCDVVTAQPTEYGIKFVTKSLSPFVLDWGGYEGDLTPEQPDSGEGEQGGEGDHDGGEGGASSADPEWPLQRLELWQGKTTVKGARIRDINVSTRSETIIEKSTIANLAIEYRKDDSDGANQGLRIKNSQIGSLFLPVNDDTPTSQNATAVVIGQDSAVEIMIVPIDSNWSGTITTPLVVFEEEGAWIQLLILEGNWTAFDPGWLNGVTIMDVDWPDNTTGQPVPYADFLTLLNQ